MIIYEAMGAKAIDKKDPKRPAKIENMFLSDMYIAQRKLNGERLMVFKTDDEHVQAFGRGFSKTNERMEKTHHVPHILSELQMLPDGTILDGEVLFIPQNFTPDDIRNGNFVEDFWACREIMGSHPPVAIEKQDQNGYLHYVVFDVLSYAGIPQINESYVKRLAILNFIKNSLFPTHFDYHVHVLPIFATPQSKRELFNDAMTKGLEGIIFKRIDGLYIPGKKPTDNWIKYKKEASADCIIIGYNPPARWTEITRDGKNVIGPDGKPVVEESKYYLNNWIGAVWLGQYVLESKITKEQQRIAREILNNCEYPCYVGSYLDKQGQRYVLAPIAKMSGMDESMRAEFSTNPEKYLGKVAVIKYFEKTSDSYFQLVFEYLRDDKPAEQCLFED